MTQPVSDMLLPLAPALGNHLWQSTLFALTAGLLTLFLRRNHARVRYALWLAASLKFLLPISLLVAFAIHLTRTQAPIEAPVSVFVAIKKASQPFSQAIEEGSSHTTQFFPALLGGIWLCGTGLVTTVWFFRWRRIGTALRMGVPLHAGREVQALRRIERLAGIKAPIQMSLSSASLEPGVFGVVRPTLLWPEGISEHLKDAHLEAILAHEICHVRRRDNLAAALHMLVAAVFWFHPLVWWLGARLVEERERACDEKVLEMGSAREIYAESILKTCQFCAGLPLACVSGITGADLKQRILYIMTLSSPGRLTFSTKLLLSMAALLAVGLPVLFGLMGPRRSPAKSPSVLASTSLHPLGALAPIQQPVLKMSASVSKQPAKPKTCSKTARASKTVPVSAALGRQP